MSLSGVLFRVLLSVLGSIPYPVLYRTGKLLSFLISVFPNKHKNITTVNLGVVFKDKTIAKTNELKEILDTLGVLIKLFKISLFN